MRSALLALALLGCWLVASHGVPLPATDEVADLDGAVFAEVLEGKEAQAAALPKKKVAAHTLRKNSMGLVDGTKNTWKPFVDKVPKSALSNKRTFIPKTPKAFRLSNLQKQGVLSKSGAFKESAEQKRIDEEVHQAANPSLKSAFQKTLASQMKAEKVQETKDLKVDPKALPMAATKAKGEVSERWPFGKPGSLEASMSLLQDDEDGNDDGDADTGVERRTPNLVDPVQDMMVANGWSPEMVHVDRSEEPKVVSTSHDHDNKDDDDDDDNSPQLGESADTDNNDDDEEDADAAMLGEGAEIAENEGELPEPKTPVAAKTKPSAPQSKASVHIVKEAGESQKENIDVINGAPAGVSDP
jgi:hypothetical protein